MSTIKKSLVLGLAVLTVLGSSGTVFAALSQSQIDAIVAMLQSFNVDENTINNVKAALTGQPVSSGSGSGSQTTPSTACEFKRNLTVGSRGDDVKCLQKYLNESGYKIAESGAGSPGNETTYFGPATKAALIKWQKANNVSPASGFFGPLSRAKYSELAKTGTTGGQTGQLPASAYLKVESVSLPGSYTLPDGSIYNKVLRLKFSAGNKDEKVTGLTVTRGGFIANTNITGVSVWDDNNNRYGNIVSSLTADGKAIVSFPTTPFVVPAGQTKYLNVAINIDGSAGSGSVSFSVNSVSDIKVSSDSSQVEGPFPLVGQTYTIVDGSNSLGDARIDDVAISGISQSNAESASYEGNVEIGDTQREVFKLRINQSNSKEAIKVSRITLYVAGNIVESTDLKNFKLYSPEGNVLATADRSYDRYVTFNLETPYVIEKGLSKDFSVRTDIADGSNRYFTLYVQNDYDVLVYGVNSGAGILVTDSSGSSYTSSDTQNTSTGYFKIKQGDLVVSKANTSPSGKVLAPGVSEAVLAEFTVKSAGEKVEIRKMGVGVKYSGGLLTGSLTVRDKDSKETYLSLSADTNGLQTISNISSLSQQNLSSYIVLESGQTKTLQVVGQVSLNATSSWNYTVYVGNFNIKRYSTNDFVDKLSSSVVSGNQVSVGDVTLTVVKNASFADTTRVKGSADVKIGEFILQASNVDNIKVSSINLSLNTTTGISNLKVKVGTDQVGSTVSSPSTAGNVFTLNLEVEKNKTKTISVYADILSTATGTLQVSVASGGITGYGVSTSKTLENTPSSAVSGQTITLADARLNIALDANTPASKLVLASSQNVEISKLKFTPLSDTMKLTKLTLALATGTASSTISNVTANFGSLALYDSQGNKVSSDGYVVNGEVVFDGLNVSLPQDSDSVLVVKANFNGATTVTPKSIFAIKVKSTSTDDLVVEKNSGGVLDSNVTLPSDNAISRYFMMHVAAPVVTHTGMSTTNNKTDVELYKFTVTNPSNDVELTLNTTTIYVNVSNAHTSTTLTGFELYSVSDNVVVATSSASISGSGTTTVTFALSNYNVVGKNASKSYILRADFSNYQRLNTNAGITVSANVTGNRGYASGNSSYEPDWADGGLIYSYVVTSGTSTTYSNLSASDSYPLSAVSTLVE